MVHFSNRRDIPEVSLTVSFRTFVRLTLLIIATIFLLAAIHRASHALLLIFTAFFLALALNAPVNSLAKLLPGKSRGDRSLATILSFLIVVLVLGAFIASFAPPLVKQTDSFINAAPRLVRDFRSQDSETGKLIRKYHLQDQVDTIAKQLGDRLKNAGGSTVTTAQRIGSSFFSMLTIFVLTFMMLVEGPRWIKFFREIVPDRHHARTDRLMSEMYGVIRGFVNGQVLLAAVAALLISPALFLLHISYPVALMVVVFFCGLIPLVGHTIGAIIVTTVALFESTSAALIILGYYILYQQVENYLVQPKIQANSTNMSPLLVFMAVVIGVSFGGLFIGLVAIPVAGCLRILVLEYLRTQKIIDESEYKAATSDAK